MIATDIIIAFGILAAFAFGLWRGKTVSDEVWMSSAATEVPIIKKGFLFKVECIGGE